MIQKVPENEYIKFQGHEIVTIESVEKYHSSDQVKAFKEWFYSAPIKGVWVCDYERWCKGLTVDTNEQYEELSERLKRTLTALHEIAELGANPLTKYDCKTREDLMRHMDKMWIAALNAIEEERIWGPGSLQLPMKKQNTRENLNETLSMLPRSKTHHDDRP